jgi:hypothetical protein
LQYIFIIIISRSRCGAVRLGSAIVLGSREGDPGTCSNRPCGTAHSATQPAKDLWLLATLRARPPTAADFISARRPPPKRTPYLIIAIDVTPNAPSACDTATRLASRDLKMTCTVEHHWVKALIISRSDHTHIPSTTTHTRCLTLKTLNKIRWKPRSLLSFAVHPRRWAPVLIVYCFSQPAD